MIVIALADSLNRFRSLSDQEVRWLEAAVRREQRRNGHKREFWTRADVSRLKRLLGRGKKVKHIATLIGKSEDAVWSKLRALPELRGCRGTNQHGRKARQGPMDERQAIAG